MTMTAVATAARQPIRRQHSFIVTQGQQPGVFSTGLASLTALSAVEAVARINSTTCLHRTRTSPCDPFPLVISRCTDKPGAGRFRLC